MQRWMMFRKRCAALVLTLLVGALWMGSAWAQGDTLHVRRISPSGDDVTPGQEVVIQFDRKMVPLGHMGRKTGTLPVTISPDPGCQWRWLNTSELACRLPEQHRFAPATRYTITVGTQLKALDDSYLDEAVVRTFTTRRPSVDWTHFQDWQSPVTPEFEVRLNIPITAKQVAAHLSFVDDDGNRVGVKVKPFTKKRQGPVWLPVPGVLGAVMEVTNPEPSSPLDVNAAAGAGRRIWLVLPAKPLDAATKYKLRVKPGMRTELGPLPGTQHKAVASLQTYGDFTFVGVECLKRQKQHGSHRNVYFTVHAGHTKKTAACNPDHVRLLFSAPVPRATLAAATWKPLPVTPTQLKQLWCNYPQWLLRERHDSQDAAKPDDYPLSFRLGATDRYTVTVPAGVKDRFGRTLKQAGSVTFHTSHHDPFIDPPPSEAVLETNQPTIVPLRFTNLDSLDFSHRQMHAEDLTSGHVKSAGSSTDLLDRPDLAGPIRQLRVGYVPVRALPDHHTPFARPLRDASMSSHWQPGHVRVVYPVWKPAPSLLDRLVHTHLHIRDLLGHQSGVVWGTLDGAPNNPRRPRHFIGEVTPWQVLVKVGHYDTLVWVSRWDNGKPVAGAHVKLLHGHDKDLNDLSEVGHTVKTDSDGLAVLTGTVDMPRSWFHQWKDDSNFYVGATQGKDLALLPLDGHFNRSLYSASHSAFWENASPPHGHMRTWAVTEQGIYKPGSDVKYAAFVRAEGETTLKPAPGLSYKLAITDPKGNTILKREHVKLSANGGTSGKLHIPKTAAMGWYDIHISWPLGKKHRASRLAGRFLVTDFVPAAFKVHLLVKGEHFSPGQTVHIATHATLHAGGPYSDAKVKFTTRLVAQRFSPETSVASGYTFGDARKSLPKAKTLSVIHDQLDHTGHTKAKVTLPAKSDVTYGRVDIEAAVESARGTQVANHARVPFFSRDRFVGVDTRDWMQQAEKPFTVNYVVVNPAGRPEAGSKVSLALQRKTRTSVRIKNGVGDFAREEKVKWVRVDSCQAVSTTTPGHCRLTAPQAGSYRVVATVADTHGKTQRSVMHTWVTGPGEVVWSHKGKGVTLVPDQSSYHVGDVAHVLVQNPFPGAHALITVERYGVLWKKMVTLKGSAPVIDVPIGKGFYPGAYLSVAIFSPRVSPPADPDLGRPELALGYVALKIVGKGSSLKVHVTPARDTYKPGQSVNVKVSVKRRDGHAAGKTQLVVAVVDQGVLDLLQKGTRYYDPRASFYAPPKGPDITNYSLANQLLTRLQPKVGKGDNPGGGGGASVGPNIRSHFKYAAYWNPDLETDASGHAHFHFKLPDNLTRWRILVIALRPADKMGLGIGSVRVNLPLQIKPALPNQMHVGDHFGAGFNVTNRTKHALNVTTHIAASGVIAGGKAMANGTMSLTSFSHQLAWLQLDAGKPGTITLTASARSGKLGDAVRAHIPVKPVGTEVVAAQYGSTTGSGAKVPVKVPPKAIPGTSHVDVTFAPTLVGGLEGAFKFMRDYPLDTWEAQMSRGVLASDYLRLKPVIGKSMQWPDAKDDVDATLIHAASFQAPNGGMAFWIPRNRFVSPYLSVYTALAFDWLDDAGHKPSPQVRKSLRDYLHKQILAKQGDKASAPVLRAGAMAALAMDKHGQLDKGAVAGLLPKLHRMRLFGQALLLDAAIAIHDRTSADAIMKSLFGHAEESAGKMSFNQKREGTYLDLLSTPLRSNCAILDAFARYKATWGNENLLGTTPLKLMRWITGKRRDDGGWPNSQENVFCTTAIVHYADVYEKPVKGLVGRLQLPSSKVQYATFASRAAPAVKLAGPTAKPGQKFQVKLGREGKGRLYYSVQLHYNMPADALPAADAGMTLSRHYSVKRGGKWQPVTDKTVLQRGEVVRVELDVDAPTERHHVVLTDPLPGSFQAVNRHLATAAMMTPSKQPGVSILMFDGGPWPNMSIVTGGFYHRETGFDAVRFFADNLPAGHYRVVYAAQVIAPGRFIAPTPTVKEIYQPDVFGRGVAEHINVAMPGK